MAFDFNFRSVQTSREIRQARDFLLKQDLSYAGYSSWVQRAEAELFSGYKRAALAYSNGMIVGDIVWQMHKQIPRVREIKNIRIHPDVRGRYLAHFLIKQAEVEDRQEYDSLLVDARENQQDLIGLMRDMGYRPIAILNLYDDNNDVVLVKSKSQKPNLPFAEICLPNLSASLRTKP